MIHLRIYALLWIQSHTNDGRPDVRFSIQAQHLHVENVVQTRKESYVRTYLPNDNCVSTYLNDTVLTSFSEKRH